MLNPNDDGVTHINIYSQGRTASGKFLSNFTHHSMIIEELPFASIEAYWYYLGLLNTAEEIELEELAGLYGYNAKKYGNALIKRRGKENIEGFEDLIKSALKIKVFSAPKNIKDKIRRSQGLPYEHYYVFKDKIVDVKEKYAWMIEEFEKLRSEI